MRIFAKLSKITLDKGRFLKDTDSKMKEIHKEGSREMIRAIYPKVPVWTGQARGTLVPFARSVDVVIPIEPVAFRRGINQFSGETKSIIAVDLTKNRYVNTIDISLDYYQYLDIKPGRSPTSPWRSFEAGKIAYKNTISKLLDSLPKVKNYLTYVRVTNNA